MLNQFWSNLKVDLEWWNFFIMLATHEVDNLINCLIFLWLKIQPTFLYYKIHYLKVQSRRGRVRHLKMYNVTYGCSWG